MKVTTNQLRQLIREAVEDVLEEPKEDAPPTPEDKIMPIDTILTLHKKTQSAIVNDGTAMNTAYPYTASYPAPRGGVIEITWPTYQDWWKAKNAIIKKSRKDAPAPKERTAGQRRYIAMLIRNGWI